MQLAPGQRPRQDPVPPRRAEPLHDTHPGRAEQQALPLPSAAWPAGAVGRSPHAADDLLEQLAANLVCMPLRHCRQLHPFTWLPTPDVPPLRRTGESRAFGPLAQASARSHGRQLQHGGRRMMTGINGNPRRSPRQAIPPSRVPLAPCAVVGDRPLAGACLVYDPEDPFPADGFPRETVCAL